MATLTWHFANKEIKRRERAFYRRNWWRLLVVAAALATSAVVVSLTFQTVSVPLWLTVTLVVGSFVVAQAPLLDGTYNLMSGVEAERWTSKELRKGIGPAWHVIDWVPFEHHDVDHVVVGPGGVFAIETKYTESRMDLETARGQRKTGEWVTQALDNARSIRLLLRSVRPRMDVYAAVVVWGAGVIGTPFEWDGVPIHHGRELRADVGGWSAGADRLSKAEIDEIADKLGSFRAMRIQYERSVSRSSGGL